MKRILALFLLASIVLWGVACGGADSDATDTGTTPIVATAANPTADPLPATDETADGPAEATVGCEDFFRFCVTSTISGAVDATATAGMGGQVDDCAAWAAAGEPRILEMHMMQGAGRRVGRRGDNGGRVGVRRAGIRPATRNAPESDGCQ